MFGSIQNVGETALWVLLAAMGLYMVGLTLMSFGLVAWMGMLASMVYSFTGGAVRRSGLETDQG